MEGAFLVLANFISGTSFHPTVSFTTNDLFTPVSFDLRPSGNNFVVGLFNPVDNSSINYNYSYENVLVQGFRDGTLITDDSFDMNTVSTYLFDSNFLGIDTLSITAILLSIEEETPKINELVLDKYPGYSISYMDNGFAPLAHFDIDNVVLLDSNQLNPVPLPASLPLFASVIGVFGFLTRRKRK